MSTININYDSGAEGKGPECVAPTANELGPGVAVRVSPDGRVARFRCVAEAAGHRLVGRRVAMCFKSGWSHPPPICQMRKWSCFNMEFSRKNFFYAITLRKLCLLGRLVQKNMKFIHGMPIFFLWTTIELTEIIYLKRSPFYILNNPFPTFV